MRDLDVGQCAAIRVPDVNRGPADPKNLIVVVLSVKEGMYTVGCREGILMSKFTVADLQPIHENLLVPSDVPDVELGVRTAVRKASGGQGYQCTSGRGSCHRKKHVLQFSLSPRESMQERPVATVESCQP